MYPTLFRIGHFSLSTYGVLVALAFLVAAQVTAKGMGERGLKSDHAWTLVLWSAASWGPKSTMCFSTGMPPPSCPGEGSSGMGG